MPFDFSPFPKLTTPRLELSELKNSDAPEVFVFRSEPRMSEFVDRKPAGSLDDAHQFIEMIHAETAQKRAVYWGISLKNNPKLIGTICLWHLDPEKMEGEIGYELHPVFWGKGLMSEAVEAVVQFGFTKMELQKILADPKKGNAKSIKLLEKCGFACVSTDGEYLIFEKKMPQNLVGKN